MSSIVVSFEKVELILEIAEEVCKTFFPHHPINTLSIISLAMVSVEKFSASRLSREEKYDLVIVSIPYILSIMCRLGHITKDEETKYITIINEMGPLRDDFIHISTFLVNNQQIVENRVTSSCTNQGT